MKGFERDRVPDTDGLILSRGSKISSVGRKGDAADPTLMTFEPRHFLPCGRVKKVERLLVAAGKLLAIGSEGERGQDGDGNPYLLRPFPREDVPASHAADLIGESKDPSVRRERQGKDVTTTISIASRPKT